MGKFEKPRQSAENTEIEETFRQVTGEQKTPTTAEQKASGGLKNKKAAIAVICVAAAVVVAALAGGLWYYFGYTGDDGRMLPNVTAAGVNLGGMTPQEAKNVLHLAADNTYPVTDMVLHLPEGDVVLSPKDTGAELDVDAAVEAAYQYGRTGSSAARRKARREAKSKPYEVDLIPYLHLDETYLQAQMDALNGQYNTKLTQPTVKIEGTRPSLAADKIDRSAPKQTLTLTLGTPDSALDIKTLYADLLDAYNANTFSVTIELQTVQPEAIDLQAVFKEYCVEPVDAVLDEKTYTATPEVYGYGFDIAAVQKQLDAAKPGQTVTVTLDYLEPRVTVESLTKDLFRDQLASYEAYQYSSDDRSTNLRLACAAINGTILKPGDIFSFNEVVGERTEAKGYRGAGSYENGRTVTTIGGGICQVSSSLYYCTLIADLEIIERSCHQFPSDYVPLGMDATVSWGSLDFQFRNNTDHPIRIDAVADGGTVNVALYGTDDKDYYVEMSYDVVKTYQPSTVIKEYPEDNEEGYQDGDVIQSAYTGYDVVTYKLKYDKKTDELISTTKESFSDYDKRDKIVVKIKKPEPTTQPTDAEIPEQPLPELPGGVGEG